MIDVDIFYLDTANTRSFANGITKSQSLESIDMKISNSKKVKQKGSRKEFDSNLIQQNGMTRTDSAPEVNATPGNSQNLICLCYIVSNGL
jgi:hypothetical protein